MKNTNATPSHSLFSQRKIAIVLTLLAILFFPIFASAQNEEVGFASDRPGATAGADVLPKGRLQWETSVKYERTKYEGVKTTTWTLNNTLLRWGITNHAELRLQADYLYSSTQGDHSNGFANVAFGTKVKVYEGSKYVPTVALLGHVIVPGGNSADFLPKDWGGQIGLLCQNKLTSWCSIGYEADLIWSDSSKPTIFWGACLTFPLNDKLSLIAEEYNFNHSGSHENWLELGGAYMLTPRLQLDMTTDINLNYPKRYFNLMVGAAWQITQ